MTKYRVVGAYVSVHSGIVELTKEQASARSYALTDLKKSGEAVPDTCQYSVHKQTGFKRGEVFGWDEEPNKALVNLIQDADAPITEAPAAADPKPKGGKRGKK